MLADTSTIVGGHAVILVLLVVGFAAIDCVTGVAIILAVAGAF